MRCSTWLGWFFVVFCAVASAQDTGQTPLPAMAANADPAFEVATIKPGDPASKGLRYVLRGPHFAAKNATLESLMDFAFHVRTRQIEGAPAWMTGPRFDIAAESDTPGAPSEDQSRTMLRKLLAERFGLKFHTIQKIFPVYALTMEKPSPKITPAPLNDHDHSHITTSVDANGQLTAQFLYMDMREFSNVLMNFIPERQIVDETGLQGPFNFAMTVPAAAINGSADPNDAASSVIEGLRPLGFRLVAKKEPIQVVVIDSVEMPSAN
jgi:uncharacterized protein (TIGR03435 family)